MTRHALAGLLFFTVSVPVAAASVSSGFDGDADGWTVTTFNDNGNPNFLSVLSGGLSVSFVAAGGDPGGFIGFADPDDGWSYFVAPAKFLGDQSDKLGGGLSFSLQHTLNGGTLTGNPPHAVLLGASLVLVHDAGGAPALAPAWSRYGVPLVASAWRIGSVGGAAPSDAQFAEVLGDLGALLLAAEFVTPVVEVSGLDSVALTPVPAPAALWSLASALGLLGLSRRRRRG